jgi:hypothetical protein
MAAVLSRMTVLSMMAVFSMMAVRIVYGGLIVHDDCIFYDGLDDCDNCNMSVMALRLVMSLIFIGRY